MNMLADNAAEDWAGHDRARLEPGFERLHRTALGPHQLTSGSFLGLLSLWPSRSALAPLPPFPNHA
jgi:hypothetical protein